ncbi:hypothetical protein LSTR_LSTR004190 [Laodelphax striatellus]|uniref:Uncharacterized protein n=1 Tax=Laodelphax striatellus TaxID=195883 RepID=A0A482X9P3_LAOST|nr:hypothetical protein LSTR_LSTR004190 [Laodelphax striatellus]
MWDKITFGLNTEGESVNFGTRILNDNNIYAFETKQLATIHKNATSNVDEINQSLKPISVSHQKTMCIAIENSLVIFDALCSKVLLNIHFDSTITTFKMCNDGIFLFITLRNLDIFCVHCPSGKYERIFQNAEMSFKIKIQSKFPNEIVYICIEHIESKNAINLFFVLTCGMVVRLSELDMNLLNESFNCVDSQKKVENVFANTPYFKLLSTLTESHNAIEAVCEFKNSLFISNGKMLVKYPLHDTYLPEDKNNSEIDIRNSSTECSMPTGVLLKNLECSQKLLIGRTTDEKLIVICPVTLCTLAFLPYKACVDFTVVKGKSEETILIFTIDKMMIVSSEDFSESYVIKLPNSSLPVYNQNVDDPSFEEILFVELSDEKSLTIKVLEETQLQARLEKLLRKGRFEEAKRFCQFFALDVQCVYHAEAARMNEELMPWTQNKTVTIDGFIALLELIEDIKLVCSYCINAITADSRDILKLLNYGMKRVKQSVNKKGEVATSAEARTLFKLHSDMGAIILRLNTHIIIHEPTSADQWISFSKATLLYEIRNHLRKGELYAAKTIWCRHWNEIRSKLKFLDAIEMLSDVPDSISVEESADWTRELVTNILLNDPSALESIINWTVEKILSFDLIDKDNWLEKGISLAELMLSILLKLEESEATVGLEHILIEKLSSVLRTLHQILCLKNVYHINITYTTFVEEDFNEVVFSLLTKIPVDLITDLINDFLTQILMVKNLDSDSVYSYCIKRLVRFLPVELVYPGAPWEVRAVKITRAIYAAQVRLECVLSLLKVAAAPLSKFILETVDEALKLYHPLTAAIREQLMLVPSKLVLKKYGFTEIYNNENMETIMNFIIRSGDENNFADSLIIAKTIDMEDDVYIGFATKYIEEGNHEKVLEMMNKLEPCMRERIQTRLNLTANLIRDIDVNKLQMYLPHCSGMDQGLARSCQLELELNIKSHVAEMHKKNKNRGFADIAFRQLIKECVKAEYIVQEASRLTEIFEIPHRSVVLRLASIVLRDGNGDLAVELLSYLVGSECIDDIFCKELLEFLGEHIFNLATFMCNSLKPLDVSSLLRTLSNMSLQSEHVSSILQAVEISIWINLLTGCRPQVTFFSEDVPSTRLFQFLPQMVTSVLKKYISFAGVQGSNNRIVQRAFRNTVIPETHLTVNELANSVKSVVKSLTQIEPSTVNLQVLSDLYCCLSSVTKHAIESKSQDRSYDDVDAWASLMNKGSWETLFNRCLSDVLQKVIIKKVPDKNLNFEVGLAILIEYSEEEATCWVKNQLEAHSHSANRTKAVSILGAFYGKLRNLDEELRTYMASVLKGHWGNKLAKLGLPYKEFITMDTREVVMKLITIPNIDLDVLREYCNAFHYDFNDCLLNYVKHLILSWEPDMVVTYDTSGARVLHVNNKADEILVKMKSVSSLVDNHVEFMEFFTLDLWKKVNCYYYELYIVLLDLFDHVSEQLSDRRYLSTDQYQSMKQYRAVLKFLMNYRRTSPTSSQEEDMFFTDYNHLHTLPAISEFRLPFTYLVADKYNILKSELSLSTYKLWFAVSSLFCLDKGSLCSLAISRMNLEKLASTTNKSKDEWCIHVCNEKLLEEIKECVSYIQDKEKACACLFFVVNNLPPGADQVTVANMCYNDTAKWAAEDGSVDSVAHQRLEKVHKKLLKVTCTHILYKYNLARREYLDLVLNPNLLIHSLYQDPAILSKSDSKLVHCPDINEAVTEIGKVHKKNIAGIKLELLDRWLVPDLDDSIISESHTIKSVAKLTDDDNLTRACYLLKYEEPKLACNYLVSIAFTNEMQSTEVRLRALQCLIKLITPQEILDATGKNLNEIRRYMKILWFSYGLEQLGLNCSVEMFSSRDKSELVEEILNKQSLESAILAAHICREYDLRNPHHWNIIFKRFTESSMILVDQMEEFIFRLGIDWYLLDQEILSSAWNRLIYLRISQVDELSGDKESRVKKLLANMNKCPSPALLNKKVIKDHLKRLNCENFLKEFHF